ncbi:hypothetical protein ACOMHN_002810 [Nucella lapillus]
MERDLRFSDGKRRATESWDHEAVKVLLRQVPSVATVWPHPDPCLEIPAWRSLPGDPCLEIPAWRSLPGDPCLEIPAWRSLPGDPCLEIPAWRSLPGDPCLPTSLVDFPLPLSLRFH